MAEGRGESTEPHNGERRGKKKWCGMYSNKRKNNEKEIAKAETEGKKREKGYLQTNEKKDGKEKIVKKRKDEG